LAVPYKPLAGPLVLRLPALTAIEGSELLPQVLKGEPFLSEKERERERERERESHLERSTTAKT
jgi:hypothetical protein